MMFYLEYTVSKYSMSTCYSIAQFLHALVESRYNIAIFDMVNIHHARKACFKLYKTTVLLVVKFTLLNGMPWWHIVSTVTVISVSLNSFAVILLQYFSNYLWQGGYVITHVCCPFVIGISQKFQQICRFWKLNYVFAVSGLQAVILRGKKEDMWLHCVWPSMYLITRPGGAW